MEDPAIEQLADYLRSVYLGSDKLIETPSPKRPEWIRLALAVERISCDFAAHAKQHPGEHSEN